MTASAEERLVLRAVAALVAFLLGAAVLAATVHRDEGGDDALVEAPGVTGPPVSTGAPVLGEDLAAYVAQRRHALDALRGPLAAVVSFDAYRTETDARALLEPVKVRALLVVAPGGRPAVVDGRLPAWASAERRAAQEERAALETMAASTDDEDFAAQFRADVARLDALLQGLDPAGPVVYGAVVEAPADVLRRLAGAPGVRLVDAVGRRAPAKIEPLTGIRPEETVRAGDPPTRPA